MAILNSLGIGTDPSDEYNNLEAPPDPSTETYTPATVTGQGYTAAQQGPNALAGANGSAAGQSAQMQALRNLQQTAQGGLNAADRANLWEAQGQQAAQNRAAQGAILQGAAARGGANSGSTLAAQLSAAQGAQTAGANAGVSAAGGAANRALQANQQAGELGGNIDQQAFGKQATIGGAQNAINANNAGALNSAGQFNANAANSASQFNSNAGSEASRFRAQQLQQQYQNAFNAAQAKAATDAANNAANATLISSAAKGIGGGLAGAGLGSAGAAGLDNDWDPAAGNALYSQRGYAHGGPVGNAAAAPVAGDSRKNDIVDAKLSPGEIVLPRSVAGSPDKILAFLTKETGMCFDRAMKASKPKKVSK